MNNDKMAETASRDVPRPRVPPNPNEVLDQMVKNRCYVVADLVVKFEEQYDPSRGTIRNRLEYLVEQGDVERRKHANETVTYRRPDQPRDSEKSSEN